MFSKSNQADIVAKRDSAVTENKIIYIKDFDSSHIQVRKIGSEPKPPLCIYGDSFHPQMWDLLADNNHHPTRCRCRLLPYMLKISIKLHIKMRPQWLLTDIDLMVRRCCTPMSQKSHLQQISEVRLKWKFKLRAFLSLQCVASWNIFAS